MRIRQVAINAISIVAVLSAIALSEARFSDITDYSGLGSFPELGWGTAMLDYNHDGYIDIFVVGHDGFNRLYRNNGDLTFADVTADLNIQGEGSGWGVCYGDFNADYEEEIYISRRDGIKHDLFILTNGIYGEYATDYRVDVRGGLSHAACFAPLTKNLVLDLLVSNQNWPAGRYQSLALFHSHVSGPFDNVTQAFGLADSSHLWQGVACGDYNNDNYLDIFVAAEPNNCLFRNNGGNGFVNVSDSAGFINPLDMDTTGMAAAWGDYNNDGWLDVYITPWRYLQHGKLFRNNSDGTFTEVTEFAGVGLEIWANNGTWGDFDNDGWLDFYVVTGSYGARLYMNNHDGTFEERASNAGVTDGHWCCGSSVGDIDRDGKLDIVVAHYADGGDNPNKTTLYHNITQNNNNWVVVKVNGYYPNYDAIGARVRIVAGGISQIREVSGGAGFGCQNMLPLHFGLGTATIIDSLIISFPNLTVPPLIYTDVEPNRYIVLPDIDLDVASLLISAPDSILDCEQQHPIYVKVKNMGNVNVNNVKVICQISYDSIMTVSDTTIISFLSVEDSTIADFGPFDFLQCGKDYEIIGFTKLLGDYTTNNDTATATIYSGYSHDIASAVIVCPDPDSVVYPILPRILIENRGINSESGFNVFCSISDEDSIIYSNQIHYTGTLHSKGSTIIEFPDFTPTERGTFSFSFYHTLLGDRNRGNDFINLNLFLNPTSMDDNNTTPNKFGLNQNYPNPFNSSTKIEYYLPFAENISLEAFDLLGTRVAILVNGQMSAGAHSVIWDCSGLSSGIYFYRLSAGNKSDIKKMILLK